MKEKFLPKEKIKDGYALTRFLYLLEAALEYFVSIAVGTVYLAKIANYVGMSDGLTAIITAFVPLGCGFQLASIFINVKSVKRFVSVGHVVSQLIFTALYIIPLINMPDGIQAVVLVVSLFVAQVVHNVISAPKTNWFMSAVQNENRGKYTAVKEIIALVGGSAFSFLLSYVIDRYEAENNMRAAFLVGAVILGVLTVLHTFTLVFSKSSERGEVGEKKTVGFRMLLKNKTLMKIIVVTVLIICSQYATTSFSGTYMNKELGFSMTFSSAVVLLGSLSRVIFSVPFGKLADKKGFCHMLVVAASIAAVGYLINIFTVPSNGKVFYTIYYALYCTAMAGMNSAIINLIYDYVEPEERSGALALNQTISGIAGFLITIVLTPILSFVQNEGNKAFGISVYAQQIFSFISFALVVALIAYLVFVVRKLPRVSSRENNLIEK